MIFIDYGCSDNCINTYSYGEICVKCGCCEYEKDYLQRLKNILSLYKEELERNKKFNRFSDIPELAERQKKNVIINHKYFTKKIRYIKTEINRLRRIK